MLIGSFVSFKSPNYLIDSVKESIANGANAMMIYLGPPQSSLRSNPQQWKIKEYKESFSHIISPDNIIVHAPYIVNLANFEKAKFGIDFLQREIKMMNLIGAKYLVLHPGAILKQDIDESLKFLGSNIKQLISITEDVVIVLETMAGKGTEIGSNLQQLKKLVDLIDDNRVGICLDTCHLWDSGIDLKSDFELNEGREFFKELEKLQLLDKIKVVHLNDSKNPCGLRKDRHENIGKGLIGLKALKKFANHAFFKNIPIILETPYINEQIYKEEIKIIKE